MTRRLKTDSISMAKRDIDDLLHFMGDDEEAMKASPKLMRIMERLQKETGKAAQFRGVRYFSGVGQDGVKRRGRGIDVDLKDGDSEQ